MTIECTTVSQAISTLFKKLLLSVVIKWKHDQIATLTNKRLLVRRSCPYIKVQLQAAKYESERSSSDPTHSTFVISFARWLTHRFAAPPKL